MIGPIELPIPPTHACALIVRTAQGARLAQELFFLLGYGWRDFRPEKTFCLTKAIDYDDEEAFEDRVYSIETNPTSPFGKSMCLNSYEVPYTKEDLEEELRDYMSGRPELTFNVFEFEEEILPHLKLDKDGKICLNML